VAVHIIINQAEERREKMAFQELTMDEVIEVSGADMSGNFAAVSGILWTGAEVAAVIPGGQAVGAFLGLGAGIMAGVSGAFYLYGQYA